MTRDDYQYPLFVGAPFIPSSETSKEAAQKIVVVLNKLQGELYAAFQEAGVTGLTDEEIALGMGWDGSTARPRRVELARKGIIVKAGYCRLTTRGRKAEVWRLA